MHESAEAFYYNLGDKYGASTAFTDAFNETNWYAKATAIDGGPL